MTEIRYLGRPYRCRFHNNRIIVQAKPGLGWHETVVAEEIDAVRWLCDHSLRKGKARRLVDAAKNKS